MPSPFNMFKPKKPLDSVEAIHKELIRTISYRHDDPSVPVYLVSIREADKKEFLNKLCDVDKDKKIGKEMLAGLKSYEAAQIRENLAKLSRTALSVADYIAQARVIINEAQQVVQDARTYTALKTKGHMEVVDYEITEIPITDGSGWVAFDQIKTPIEKWVEPTYTKKLAGITDNFEKQAGNCLKLLNAKAEELANKAEPSELAETKRPGQ